MTLGQSDLYSPVPCVAGIKLTRKSTLVDFEIAHINISVKSDEQKKEEMAAFVGE